MTRLPQWDTVLLPEFIEANRHRSFAWGSWDCSLFAAEAIQAITGVDVGQEFRGRYKTERSAMRTIKRVTGGCGVEAAAAYVASAHGMAEIAHPRAAGRGDLVVADNAGRTVAGIVAQHGRSVLSVGEHGLTEIPLAAIKRAWRV